MFEIVSALAPAPTPAATVASPRQRTLGALRLGILSGSLCAVLFVGGCATTTPAPGLLETEAALTKGRAEGVARTRPERVEEARDLLRRARQADARGEREKATLLARQALQTFVAAENQEGRDEATVALRALERRGVPAAPGSASPSAREAPPDAGRHTTVIIDRGGGGASAPPPSAAAVPPVPSAPQAPGTGDGSLRALAERTLVALQFKRSESIGQAKDQLCPPTFRELESLIDLSQKRFDAHDYERSYEFSVRAEERFRACEAHESATAKKQADGSDAARKKASAAVQKAQTELARARTVAAANDPSLLQGAQLLHDAEGWLGRNAYPEAEDSATKAHAVLVKVKAPAASAAKASPTDKDKEKDKDKKSDDRTALAKDPGSDPAKRETPAEKQKTEPAAPAAEPARPVVLTLDRSAEQLVERRLAATSDPSSDPAWKRVYPIVFRALASRDKAKEHGGDKVTAAITEAEPRLEAARSAWSAKSYVAAETAALAAIEIYERALTEAKAADSDEARASAESAVRDAAIAAQVCEREACDKRDPQKLTAGKELLASARRSFDAKRWTEARQQADQARGELDGALAIVRKDASDAALDAATKQKLAAEASDALDAATTTRKVCEQKACATRDAEKWLRASESLRAAAVARNDERFARARDLAKEADKAMRELLGLPPGFEIPSGVTKVVRSGDVLKLLPAVTFTYAGKPTPASAAAIDELARTLLANKASLKRVLLAGRAYGKAGAFTQRTADNRGKGLRDALVARGVPADLLDPSGQVLPSGGDTSQQVEARLELQEIGR